jgi:chemotaxis protein MotA
MSGQGGWRPDVTSIVGIILAACGIVGGLILEKGNVRDIAQYTAAVIVLGGTGGALMISTPLHALVSSVAHLRVVFFERTIKPGEVIDQLIVFATKARKQGIVSLENDALQVADPFMRKALNLAVDGTDLEELRSIMEQEIELHEAHSEEAAKVFDAAGGYSPTIGIIGAVLGLIQVMKNLSNISEVGHGIAVAFVATIYGVALANVFLLPAGSKIRGRAAMERRLREMVLAGVISILEGSNPKMIRNKLEAYVGHSASKEQSLGPQRAA